MLGRRSHSVRDRDATVLQIVIAGGGVAALETALALRQLADQPGEDDVAVLAIEPS